MQGINEDYKDLKEIGAYVIIFVLALMLMAIAGSFLILLITGLVALFFRLKKYQYKLRPIILCLYAINFLVNIHIMSDNPLNISYFNRLPREWYYSECGDDFMSDHYIEEWKQSNSLLSYAEWREKKDLNESSYWTQDKLNYEYWEEFDVSYTPGLFYKYLYLKGLGNYIPMLTCENITGINSSYSAWVFWSELLSFVALIYICIRNW